jgi:hypothetical protein
MTILPLLLLALAAPSAQSSVDCGTVSATHGSGATWRHYSATISLDGSGASCDEARSVIASWLDSDEPDQGEWFCQSSHGAASAMLIGGCEHFRGGDLSSPPDASAVAAGTFDVAVARRCGGSLRAYAIKCRTARKVRTHAVDACASGHHLKSACRVVGYRCRAHGSKVRCQRGRRREAAFRL